MKQKDSGLLPRRYRNQTEFPLLLPKIIIISIFTSVWIHLTEYFTEHNFNSTIRQSYQMFLTESCLVLIELIGGEVKVAMLILGRRSGTKFGNWQQHIIFRSLWSTDSFVPSFQVCSTSWNWSRMGFSFANLIFNSCWSDQRGCDIDLYIKGIER